MSDTFEAVFASGVNSKGHIYPETIWHTFRNIIQDRRCFCVLFREELIHGEDFGTNLSDVCALVKDVKTYADADYGYRASVRLTPLDTPFGLILKRLMRSKVPVFVVPNGIGYIGDGGRIEGYNFIHFKAITSMHSTFAGVTPLSP